MPFQRSALPVLTAVTLCLGASAVEAQEEAATPRWLVHLEERDGEVVVEEFGLTRDEFNGVSSDQVARLVVLCVSPVLCSDVRVRIQQQIGDEAPPPVNAETREASASRVTVAIPGNEILRQEGATSHLEIVLERDGESEVVERYQIEQVAADGLNDGRDESGTQLSGAPATGAIPTEAELRTLAQNCAVADWQAETSPEYYERSGNRATFYVVPFGNVLARPPAWIDEDDQIQLKVLTDSGLVPVLKVARTSTTRTVGELRLLGAAQIDSLGPITRQSTAERAPTCTWSTYQVGDFAPGEGEITLSGVTTDGDKTLGTVKFGVNPLYDGAFSFGAVRTDLVDPTFGLVPRGTGQVINASDAADRLVFALTYSGFVFGKVDPEKPIDWERPWRHVAPMVGMLTRDAGENWLFGATVDLSQGGVYLNLGWHVGKVTTLDPRARNDDDEPLEAGDPFTGQVADIPTVTDTRTGFFWGVTVDLRAALGLVRGTLTGGGG